MFCEFFREAAGLKRPLFSEPHRKVRFEMLMHPRHVLRMRRLTANALQFLQLGVHTGGGRSTGGLC